MLLKHSLIVQNVDVNISIMINGIPRVYFIFFIRNEVTILSSTVTKDHYVEFV